MILCTRGYVSTQRLAPYLFAASCLGFFPNSVRFVLYLSAMSERFLNCWKLRGIREVSGSAWGEQAGNRLFDRCAEVGEGAMVAAVHGTSFQKPPQPFDQVEIW